MAAKISAKYQKILDNYKNDKYDPDKISAEEKNEIIKVIDELCESGNAEAIEIKAYACYGGNWLYECDWNKAKELLLTLIELQGDEDPFIYNTLGYIYYYGRCNNGVPEYDEALKHFNVGAANGIHESIYKLADMLQNGYGAPKSEKGAAQLILGLYDESLEMFCNENYACKLADVAFRIGKLFEYGRGVEKDIELAFLHYLIAEYAISKRMEMYDFYGDKKVKKACDDAYDRVIDELPEGYLSGVQRFDNPGPLGYMLSESAGIDVTIDKKGREYYLTAERIVSEDTLKNVLIAMPEAGYCELTNKVTLQLKGVKKLSADDFPSKAFITRIRYNEDDDMWEFFYRDTLMLAFSCKEFLFENYKYDL